MQVKGAFAGPFRLEGVKNHKDPSMKTTILFAAVLTLGAVFLADAADDAAAEALMKKSGCFGCHSLDKKKAAPSYKDVAAKYKGKADAEQKIVKHLTTSPTIKFDGKDEPHDGLKTKNEAEVKNVAAWILSR